MRILVYPHDLGIGGSQINAIEIAGKMAQSGHQVTIFGRPGPLVDRVIEMGMDFIEAPEPRRRPSPAILRTLTKVVRERGIEVMHGYEWPPALECWLAAGRLRSVTAVATVMSMAVAPFLPRRLPLVVGTEQIAHVERQRGRSQVTVIKPPVDLCQNSPAHLAGTDEFRKRWDLDDASLNVVMVTRLAQELKLEGLIAAIDTVPRLSSARPIRLLIVGGGAAESQIRARAQEANDRAGRRAVVLTGELTDPRPAYQVADVVLGMGSSALKALAFAKPLVVQGERGFWQLLTPDRLPTFEWAGWYGIGPDTQAGPEALSKALATVVGDDRRRAELGQFGRAVAEDNYGLDAAARRQADAYMAARLAQRGTLSKTADAIRTGGRYVTYQGGRKLGRLLGMARLDDFNSRPVVLTGPDVPLAH